MKKLTSLIFAAILVLMAAGLQAQVAEVCAGDGTDSVTLSLSHYQYGNIQWQYSEDTLTWTDVQGAHDTVFRCLPERECYYRARIEYPNCPADTTQVTHILFTPTADAGFDRVLSEGFVINLDGNRVNETARCMWQVIEGDSADLEDPTFRCSQFSGPDTLYKLTWTVANACGVSVDTVEIRYVHTVMYDAIAIVDTTDIILSDSAEMASGIYRIIFSNPTPSITDSTILMGIFGGGFLRRVLDFEYYGDTCEMVTSQAGLADILLEGAINLEIPLNSGSATNRGGRDLSYTRASIMNDSRYGSGQWGELLTDIMLDGYSSSMTRNRDVFGFVSAGPLDLSGGAGTVQLVDRAIYFSDGTLADVIKHDFWKDPTDGDYHAYVTLISDLHIDYTLRTTDDQATVAINVAIPTAAGFEKEGVISVGLTIPISLSATFSGVTEIPVRITKPIRLGAFYKGNLNPFNLGEDLRLVDNSEKAIVEKNDAVYVSDFDIQFSVGAQLKLQLWKLPGFQWSILPTLSYSRCTNTTTGFQREKVRFFVKEVADFSLKPYLGVDAGARFDEPVIIDEETWYSPTRISTSSNRNLVQLSANSYIQDPIYVHVYNQDNRPVKSGRKVLFEATGGVVSSTPSGSGSASAFALTDGAGLAKIYWKPLSSNATLKATVKDCEDNHVKGSPLYFYSNGVGDLCLNSNLTLAIGNDGRFITNGGTPPFHYSSDGVSWVPEFNMSYPLAAGTYFVKDVNGCIASTTYTVQEATPPCNLTTSTYQNGLQVRFVANNGTAPYHFYVDGLDQTTSGTTQRVFQHTFAQDGEYTLTVTDANGCTQSTVVRLINDITEPTVVTLVRQNNLSGVYDQVYGAVTDNGGSAITNRGIEWSLSPDLSNATAVPNNFTGNGLGRFSCQVAGATPGTTYYACAYAINSNGYIGYGDTIMITVPGNGADIPTVWTSPVNDITAFSASCGGDVTSDGGAIVTARGVCWSTSSSPTIEDAHTTDGGGTGVFLSTLTGLNSSTTYHVRSYATNYAGTAYGMEVIFDTKGLPCIGASTVTDYDGNVYNTLQLGGQCWMKENMRCLHYPDGTQIQNGGSTANLTTPYYYDYSSSGIELIDRGYLYNWLAALSICPTGWHLPSDAEWDSLIDYVSNQSQYVCDNNNTYIAKALAATSGWNNYNSTQSCKVGWMQGLNNTTDFSAVPAGYRTSPTLLGSGKSAIFWTSTVNTSSSNSAWYYSLSYSSECVNKGSNNKKYAYSVRCLRD